MHGETSQLRTIDTGDYADESTRRVSPNIDSYTTTALMTHSLL